MKRIFLMLLFPLFSQLSFSQFITLKPATVRVGDEIKVDVISTKDFGVENSIKEKSEMLHPGKDISLGTITKPGFYKFVFKLDGSPAECFYIWAGKAADITEKLPVKKAPTAATPKQLNDFFAKVSANIKKIEFKQVLKLSVIEYLTHHVIAGTVTFGVCLSSGAAPVLAPICVNSTVEQAKDFLVIFIDQMADNMVKNAIIDKPTRDLLKTTVHGFFGIVEVVLAEGKLAKLLSTISTIVDSETSNESIKMLVEQEKQLFDQTKVIIEIAKKVP